MNVEFTVAEQAFLLAAVRGCDPSEMRLAIEAKLQELFAVTSATVSCGEEYGPARLPAGFDSSQPVQQVIGPAIGHTAGLARADFR